ncbi:MAG: Ig-like domain-containing protein, partial [Phycisphaerales bacterium]
MGQRSKGVQSPSIGDGVTAGLGATALLAVLTTGVYASQQVGTGFTPVDRGDPGVMAVLLAEPTGSPTSVPDLPLSSGKLAYVADDRGEANAADWTCRLADGFAEAESRVLAVLESDSVAARLDEWFPGRAGVDSAKASSLIDAVARGELAAEVRISSVSEIGGGIAGFSGAWADGRPLILVSREWLAAGVSHEGIVRLALEELGHAIDWFLHGPDDSPGDEGERFAAAMLGIELDPAVAARIDREDDHRWIEFEGRRLAIEEAAITFTAAFLATKPNSINTGAAVHGSLYFVSDPNNASFGASLSSNRLYGFFDYELTPGGTTYTAYGYFTFRAPTGGQLIQALYFELTSSGIGSDVKIELGGVSYDLLLVLTNVSTYGPNVSGINSSANSSSAGIELDTFVAATAPNATTSAIVASPTSVLADGTASTVTVTVRKADSSGLAGATVVLGQLGGATSTISPASATTDSNGEAAFTVSYTTAATVTYQATATAAGTETILTDTT